WSWWPTGNTLLGFARLGVAVHLAAWAGYAIWLRSRWGEARPPVRSLARRAGAALAEFLVVVAAGAAGGILAWGLAGAFFPVPRSRALVYASFAPVAFLSAFLLAATLLVGLLSRWSGDEDREWWARCGGWLLIAGITWLAVSAVVLFGPLLLSW